MPIGKGIIYSRARLKYTHIIANQWLKKGYVMSIDRISEQYIRNWLGKKRRKPLILRGARQVGKSTLARHFAANSGLTLNEVNLEKHFILDETFRSLDMKRIIREIEGLLGRNILEANSLLFLDEIQAAPHALAALRYFYEELPELPVIAAGSLLEFTLARHTFPMPVGRVEYCYMGPVSFREFVSALEPDLCPWIDAAVRLEDVPDTAHRRLLGLLREFLFVGGMPEAVQVYTESRSLSEVQEVQRSIIDTYRDDFAKYAGPGELTRLQRVFDSIPRNIGRKVKYANFSQTERSREIKNCIELLSRALVCRKVTASHASGPPLGAGAKDSIYKLIFMDVGIVNLICGGRWNEISEVSERVLVNEGPLAEQFIGQHLAYLERRGPELFYWLREGRSNNAEVDYLVPRGSKILPVEVKAGAKGSLKSLQQFVLEKGCSRALRFDLNKPSSAVVRARARWGESVRDVEFELISLPLYAVEGAAAV